MNRNILTQLLILVAAGMLTAVLAHAQSTWTGAAGDTQFSNAANWIGGVPADNAIFSNQGAGTVNVTNSPVIAEISFTPTAGQYTISVSGAGQQMVVGSSSMVNQSAHVQNIQVTGAGALFATSVGTLTGDFEFVNKGLNSTITLVGNGTWNDHESVLNQSKGNTNIQSTLSALTFHLGDARIESDMAGGAVVIGQGVLADQSTITTAAGADVTVNNTADVSNATMFNAGTVDFTGLISSTFTVGSIAGAGNVLLGSKAMSIGGDGADSFISGIISGVGGSLVKIGDGTLTINGNNTYTDGTTILGGTLIGNTTSLHGNITDNATLVFTQAADGTYTGALTGTGKLITEGTSQLAILGNQAFSGQIDVAQGTLLLSGAMPAAVTVEEGALLGGKGTVGTLVNNGRLRPGPTNTATFTAASYSGSGTLEIPFVGDQHSSLAVTGNATLDSGNLALTGTQFQIGTYTLLTSSAVSGEFATVSAPPFLLFNTIYTSSTVQVALQSFGIANAAAAGNESAVAAAIAANNAGAGQQLLALDNAAALHQAFEQMSGDALTAFYDVGLRQGRLFAEGITQREVPMDSAATVMKTNDQPIQLAMAGDAIGLGADAKKASTKKRGLWARAIGAFADTKGDSSSGSPENTANTGGFQAGYDFDLNDVALLGAFVGYTRTGISVDDRDSSGDTNALGLGVYGRYAPGAWFFDGSAVYVHNSNTMDRTISFVNETARSDFSSPLFTAYGDAGYAFEPKLDTAIEPYLALRLSHLSQNGFTETGAPDEDLTVAQKSVTSFVPEMAVRATHLFQAESRHPFTLGGGVGLEYEMGDTNRQLTASFADNSGPDFTVNGTPAKRVALDAALSGRVALSENWQAFANYGLTAASEHFDQAIMGGAKWKF